MKRSILNYQSGLQLLIAICIMTTAVPDVVAAGVLEEITVTARKRAENLQDVGISMNAVSKQDIERRFISDVRDLMDVSPNLIIDDTAQGPGGVAAIYLRGIGVADVESNFDPAVTTVIDGIYHGKLSGGILKTFDIERVEVLRGPQGTLFGRNSIGGVIKLERTRPTGELGGKVRASYGDYESYNFDGIVNFALGEDTAVKLSGARRVQGEGFYENINTGRDDGESEYYSAGINLLYTPNDNFEIEITYDAERTEQDTPPLLNVAQPGQIVCDFLAQCGQSVQVPQSGDRYKTTAQGGERFHDATFDTDTGIFEFRWDVNDSYHVDYIYGHRETEETVFTDWDSTPLLIFHTTRPEQYKQDSHELRLSFQDGGPISYVVGGYRWDSEYDIQLISFVPGPVPRTSRQETGNWAIFAEGDYAFNDQLTLTLGGRYSWDEKTSVHTGAPTIAKVDDDWSEFTPKANLRYQWHEDFMVYGGYTRGYRSGGFVGRPETVDVATTPYDPETVDNYEIGFKSEWFDNRLRLNANFFYMEYDDKQEEVSVPTVGGTGQQTIISNAATATLMGIELDFLAYLTEGLSLSGNFGWLDAEYDEFFADLTGSGTEIDNSGLELRRAPEITMSLAGTYEWPMMGGTAWIRAGYHYIDETEVTLLNSPQTHNDEQHLVDASINFLYKGTQISVFGRNLTEEDAYGIGFDVANLWTYAAPRAPRTFGVEVSHSF